MEILWSALGICAIVGFVFYVLAAHWQRLLRHQSWTIRRLTERVQRLEDLADPGYRQRLGESIPVPLEKAFTFSFHLDDSFWREKLHIPEANLNFVRNASFVASAKLEKWRSHTVATVTEVLPQNKRAGWKVRRVDFYPDPAKPHDFVPLWELPLAPVDSSARRPAVLQLVLLRNAVELRSHLLPEGTNGTGKFSATADDTLLHVPLDSELLAEFRCHDPADEALTETPDREQPPSVVSANKWRSFYSNRDENSGILWQLRIYDLQAKAEWERWKILELSQVSSLQG